MRKLLALILMVLVSAGAVYAQDIATTEEAAPAAATTEREIYTVLRYGDAVFEPELWFVTATESAARTTATWTPRPEANYGSAVAYADYLHFDGGYTADGLDELFNDAWFAGTLSSYQSYTNTLSCDGAGVSLYEFNLRFDDADYVMRYWVEPVTETRVMAFFILFPARDVAARQTLEDYAKRLYPDLSVCPR